MTPVDAYRRYVEDVKDLAEIMAGRLHGGRDLTPTIHFRQGRETVSYPCVPEAFSDAAKTATLVRGFVLPMIDVHKPQFVAWLFTGLLTATENVEPPPDADPIYRAMPVVTQTAIICATVIDPERHEVWSARLLRRDDWSGLGGPWNLAPANEQAGLLVTPVQEALR